MTPSRNHWLTQNHWSYTDPLGGPRETTGDPCETIGKPPSRTKPLVKKSTRDITIGKFGQPRETIGRPRETIGFLDETIGFCNTIR